MFLTRSQLSLTMSCLIIGIFVNDLHASSHEIPLQDRIEAIGQVIDIRLNADEAQKQKALSKLSQIITSWNGLEQPSERQEVMLSNWLSQAMTALMHSRVDWMPAPIYFTPETRDSITQESATSKTIAKKQADPVQQEPEFSEESFTDFIKRKRSKTPEKPLQLEDKNISKTLPHNKLQVVSKPLVTVTEEIPQTAQRSVEKKPNRSKWSKHSASAPLEWTDPFKDDPEPSDKIEEVPIKREVMRPVIDTNQHSNNDPSVGVNQNELSSSISDYNLAVRDISLRLAEQSRMTTDDLLKVSNELNRLKEELKFIDLYYQGLSEIDQMMLPAIESAELANQIVARRVEEHLKLNSTDNSKLVALRKVYQQISQNN